MTSARIGTAFIPVRDPHEAARWYTERFGLGVGSVTDFSAWLTAADGGASLTLMGPASGIAVEPGLDWASCGITVTDLPATRSSLSQAGGEPSGIDGDPAVCLYFTARDPDGNLLLVTDR